MLEHDQLLTTKNVSPYCAFCSSGQLYARAGCLASPTDRLTMITMPVSVAAAAMASAVPQEQQQQQTGLLLTLCKGGTDKAQLAQCICSRCC